ncbi:oligosaccharide flippase family protein [Paenibacillus sp. MMO-58]|uniref:oligosaccharide flippase family protein n=1 Tax=Paenibacillus sp. MMO-58 TaxID=3081290 RepID=UPI003019C5D8
MQKKSITKNYIYNLSYQILITLLPLITAPYISRVLGPEGVGIYSYTSSMASYFIIISVIGTNVYGQQIIAQFQDNHTRRSQLFWSVLQIRIICSLISIISYLLIIINIDTNKSILLMFTISIIANIFDISWFFQGIEEFKNVVIRNFIFKLSITFSIFIFVKDKNDLTLYVLLSVLAIFVGNLSFWLNIKKYISTYYFDRAELFEHFKQTIVFFVPQVAIQLYSVSDRIMIGLITKSSEENGYFDQSYKIINIAITVITSLNVVMRSRISYLFAKHENLKIKEHLSTAISFLCILAFPMMFGILACASDFVPLFFGPGYEECIFLIRLFVPMIFLICFDSLLGIQYLTPIGKQKSCNKVLITAAIINVVINASLIPFYRSSGAIIASIVSEAFVVICYMSLSKEIITIPSLLRLSYKYIGASLVMFISVKSITLFSLGHLATILIQVIIGILTYLLLLILLRDQFVLSIINRFKFKRVKMIT